RRHHHPGVVDQDIKPLVLLAKPLRKRLDRRQTVEINNPRLQRHAFNLAANFLNRTSHLVAAPPGHNNMHALFGKHARHLKSQPGVGPPYQCCFLLHIHHALFAAPPHSTKVTLAWWVSMYSFMRLMRPSAISNTK